MNSTKKHKRTSIVQHLKSTIGLYFLIVLAALLNIFSIWRLGFGNTYYAAGIKSMLTGFSNFFFVSFDASGFISIDKAPLSLWLDAIFAKLFGFSGVSILLPHALAGVVVTLLVYKIVQKVAGRLPAFFSSLAVTLSPVNIAVYRNNTPDALLLVFILLAIWFVIKYFERKKIKYAILSAIMIGLGFNTKMLQAFLILPALLSAILLFTPGTILHKLRNTLIFGVITALVSFSWITAVDLTPASMRPYVGGSANNSAWNLALGYNGAQRLLGEQGIGGNAGFNVGDPGLQRLFTGEMGTQTGWLLVTAICFILYFIIVHVSQIKAFLQRRKASVSLRGILFVIASIFFITEFAFFSYASFFHSYYLNIFAISIVLLFGILIAEMVYTKSSLHKKILLNIIFLSIPMQAYLIYQAKYVTWMIPLIILAGVGSLFVLWFSNKKTLQFMGIVIGVVAIFAAPLIWSGYTTILGNTATAIFIGGPAVRDANGRFGGPGMDGDGQNRRFVGRTQNQINGGNAQFVQGMPPGQFNGQAPIGMMPQNGSANARSNNSFRGMGGFGSQAVNKQVLAYLKQHYANEKYFVAVASQQQATSFILNENIGNIMTLGGFSGRDKVLTLAQFKQKIVKGELRFFLTENRDGGFGMGDGQMMQMLFPKNTTQQNGQQTTGKNNSLQDGSVNNRSRSGGGMFNANEEITNWVSKNCKAVSGISGLYDCKQ